MLHKHIEVGEKYIFNLYVGVWSGWSEKQSTVVRGVVKGVHDYRTYANLPSITGSVAGTPNIGHVIELEHKQSATDYTLFLDADNIYAVTLVHPEEDETED